MMINTRITIMTKLVATNGFVRISNIDRPSSVRKRPPEHRAPGGHLADYLNSLLTAVPICLLYTNVAIPAAMTNTTGNMILPYFGLGDLT